ncbi:PIG-L deacetylase family protein [Streptomyces sp. GDS52]|uniref:PIG-L family deacetylase n=1 Tax=Streptomyces cathayae TaxID=3031124 RepID=A0ABY8K0F2_9ACTN|nr:PIG-L family deacetylase [Streptomyces sp. HUAS 5]WGD40979.1 PIG-L family deacetylase [Streptomyces sp. HUAS 5]
MSGADGAGAHVVVSPHPDDAVWSLGGRLARWVARGVPVTVVTVFDGPAIAGARGDGVPAGDVRAGGARADGARAAAPATDGARPARDAADAKTPGATHDRDAWRSIARPALRRREDRAALTLLGAAHVSLGFTDAALRTSGDRYRYSSALRVRGPRHADDAPLADELGAALRSCCPPGTRVHGPLAAGRHVDHVLVREAVERLGRPDTAWYEDFPYPLRHRDHEGMAAGFTPLTSAEIDTWLAGAAVYASQAQALFDGTDRLRETLLARVRAHGTAARLPYAERFWLRSAHVATDAGHRPPGEPPPPPDDRNTPAPLGRP